MSQAPAAYRPPSRRVVVRRALIRVVLIFVLVASVILANWSWNRLRPVNQRLAVSSARVANLADSAQQLDLRWNQAEAERVDAAYNRAGGFLFTNKAAISQWQAELERRSFEHALEAKCQPGAAQSGNNSGPQRVSILPLTVDLRPIGTPNETNTAYQRILTLIRGLQASVRRADLVEVSVTGNSNSVRHARMVYHLWMAEEAQP